MHVIEKLVCLLMGKLFKIIGLTDIDKATDITFKILGFIGFMIETIIIFIIGITSNQFMNTFMFFVLFGAIRIGCAEHYNLWLKCLTGTTLIYTFTLIMWLYFSGNIFTDIMWTIAISLYFRKWNAYKDSV